MRVVANSQPRKDELSETILDKGEESKVAAWPCQPSSEGGVEGVDFSRLGLDFIGTGSRTRKSSVEEAKEMF